MKKRFLLIPAIGLPLLTIIPAISSYSNVTSKTTQNKANAIAEADVNNYSVVVPSWTHYAVGEKLDLRDLKVTYNDPERGNVDITNECKLSMQNGQELAQEGEFDVTIQHNDFNSSFKIYVEKEPQEVSCAKNVQKMGDINVKFRLMSNQECIFIGYDSGKGNLEIPDYVQDNGIKYFIKQIPSEWSCCQHNITGLNFKNCKHLKKICDKAFFGTCCLNEYIKDKTKLLEFPEGLEEIGKSAFDNTDFGQNKIKGYSFPSALKRIGKFAFGSNAPHIDGTDANGILEFKSIPEIDKHAFLVGGCDNLNHNCKYIYGTSIEMADTIRGILCNKVSGFSNANGYLIPCLFGAKLEIVQFTWGDIKVKCELDGDECLLIGYVSGSGTLVIPDHVDYNGKTYYVKEIPSNWSDGENDITGLIFEENVSHLKKIHDEAFKSTNCMDYYINNKYVNGKPNLLKFPEGLEEIGAAIFEKTDCVYSKIKGYSFPSTLKKIGIAAFSIGAPYIDGEDNNGILEFRSIPEIGQSAFHVFNGYTTHDCKYIYGTSIEMAKEITNILKKSNCFTNTSEFLIPCVLESENITQQFKLGDITIECQLVADECRLASYVEGSGTLVIPDHVIYNNKIFYIKEIFPNLSDGENDITGLKFEEDVSHLKKIHDEAFKGTNCLDYYMKNKNELLIFPEGLEEIGSNVFSNTDRGQGKIKGYSFPSTLKKIGAEAFGLRAPYIDGDNDNGVLEFRSIPEIDPDAFYIYGVPEHDCKYIKGKTQEMAEQIVKLVKDNLSDDFNTDDDYLIPQVIEERNI